MMLDSKKWPQGNGFVRSSIFFGCNTSVCFCTSWVSGFVGSRKQDVAGVRVLS